MRASDLDLPPDVPVWRPHPGPQTRFLSTTATEVLFGGEAGGGKTDGLVMGALRYVDCPDYTGVIFRRTYKELAGKLLPRASEWYPSAGGTYNKAEHLWSFPSGARVYFSHLEHDDSVEIFQGWEIQYLAFDELTHFTKYQYGYLRSRLRSPSGIPLRIRAGSNPGGPGHDWVVDRWAPWLRANDATYTGPRATSGEVLWSVQEGEAARWVTTEEARQINAAWRAAPPAERDRMPLARSLVFIRSRLSDNPSLQGTGYAQELDTLDPLTRAQLRDGNWLARPARGLLFKRAWFGIVDAIPHDVRYVRCWDRAGTPEAVSVKVGGKAANSDPDYTVGVKLGRRSTGEWFIADCVRLRARPREVRECILRTADLDGRGCSVALWQDPGQAGKYEVEDYVTALAGYHVVVMLQSKDKVTYAKPVSAQAEGRNIAILRADWNDTALQELEAFPEGAHDDIVDALSGAFKAHSDDMTPAYEDLGPSGAGRRI